MMIYKIENKINGKTYIGQTKNALTKRIANHLKNRSFIGSALRKYGLQSFEISVIDEANTKEVLNEKEQYWIKVCNCSVPFGYNIIQGGSYSTGMSGKHHSESSLQRMRSQQAGENNGMYGRKDSEETRKKIGDAEKGFRHSDVTKEKMSKSHTGKHWIMSEEGKQGLRHPKSEEGKANIRAAANEPERIQKLRDAWVLRKQAVMG
jgi:group I intron endonuclease